MCNLVPDAFVEKKVELFTGAHSIGHWQNYYEMNNTKTLKYSEVRHELTHLNWDYLSFVLEADFE